MGNAIYRAEYSGYQRWDGYPDSPLLTEDYPYQVIFLRSTGTAFLFMSKTPIFTYESDGLQSTGTGESWYKAPQYAWLFTGAGDGIKFSESVVGSILQANNDVYTDNTFTTVRFAQTTPENEQVWQRVRNARSKLAAFERAKAMRHKSTAWERVNL